MSGRLLSNVTMQPLIASLTPLDVTAGEFGSLIVELIDPDSVAASAGVSPVLCVFDTDALLGEAFYDSAAPTQAEPFLDALESFCAAHPEKVVLANTFCAGTARPLTFADPIAAGSVSTLEAQLNGRLREIARSHVNLLLLDIELLTRRYGEEQLMSPSFWYAGRIRYTNLMFRVLGESITQALAAYGGQARKVLVLDLDNTLWGGIVGETGPIGVTLSEDGRGAIYRDFQRAVKALKNTGVLLAICSKNNPEDVDEVFERNPMMVLKRADFACIRANWESKPENLAAIARELNVGLDSFVFLDDNAVEREIVASTIPEVAVPPFPRRLETLSRWFVDAVARPYFGKYRITTEDRAKTEQYHANESRRQFAVHLDLERFLEELRIECGLLVDAPETIVRASQMTQKTSQFNLTTLRCDIPEMTRYVRSPDHALITLEYADRFGAEGIVALALLDLAQARIDNVLVSCRVIGRKIEDRLLDKAIDVLRAHGARKVTAEFVPSRKNQVVASFYEARGFDVVAQDAGGRKTYERTIV